MLNKRHKKIQRKINRAIRFVNENIASDDVWKGRFVIKQKSIWMKTYEDKSGVEVIAQIVLKDLETQKEEIIRVNKIDLLGINSNSRISYRLWGRINNFICECTKDVKMPFRVYKKFSIDYTLDKRWSK